MSKTASQESRIATSEDNPMREFLETMTHPQEVKKLSIPQLEQLAEVIREIIVDTVSKNGGHLAPSLGVTELTLALFSKLSLPTDEIIWDVGHQCYVHKLLTGRYHRFHTLRQLDGISGFPRREESLYDSFNTSHSSTSIAAAMGKAVARDKKGYRNNIVAVIGDGALSGGLALEGLNNAGHHKTKLLVVLNDNGMSIAPSLGAYHHYLDRIRMEPFYRSSREYVESRLRTLPGIGEALHGLLSKVEDGLKAAAIPGIIFEELGFHYMGPVDGHDFHELLEGLDLALSKENGPVLLHVRTQKGKGYTPAEKDTYRLHGGGPFEKVTGASIKKPGPPSYSSVFGRTLTDIAKRDSKVIGITAAMPNGTGLETMRQELPEQFFDVAIAEQYAVCFAAGMATSGMKPVAAIYSTFLQRAYDQVVHDVCMQDLPVVFALDRAGIVGDDGATMQGFYDIAYMRTLPNMVCMSPKDENELRHMLYTAIEHDGPICIRYPRGAGLGVDMDEELVQLPLGKGEVLRRGGDVTMLAYGHMVQPTMDGAKALAKDGIEATVVNARFAKPLDAELILELARTGTPIVTTEEHALMGGFGSAVCELLNDEGLHALPVLRIGVPDVLVQHGPQAHWRKVLGLDAEGIAVKTKEFLAEQGQAGSSAARAAVPPRE